MTEEQNKHLNRIQDGTYQFDNILIRNGVAKYSGKVFDGNE
jgi:hypothetical protein